MTLQQVLWAQFRWTRILITGLIGTVVLGFILAYFGTMLILLAMTPVFAMGASPGWSVILVVIGLMTYVGIGLSIEDVRNRMREREQEARQ